MKQQWRWVVLTALVLGWLLDFLFWKQPAGINFAVYASLCIAGGLVVMRMSKQRMAVGAAALVPLALVFAALTFVRAEPLTLFLSIIVTLFLMALLAATFLGGRWLGYGVVDYVLALWRLAWSMLTRPLRYLAEIRSQESQQHEARSPAGFWPVIRGLAIALPIVVVFAALLASADVVFGRELSALLEALQLQRLPEYVFRLLYIVAAAYALTGVFLHAASQSADDKITVEGKRLVTQFLGATEASIVLGSVAVLFCAFVVVQIQYFFGGQANINVTGYTYSEYARRGYGELVAVAAFSLVMIMGLGAVTRRETTATKRVFSALSVIVVALVGVIMVSAYQRLRLYELAYGFSRLRTYVHVSLVWIGLLLFAVLLLEILRHERHLMAAILVAALGFAVSLAALNVDGFIVKQNVDRAVRGQGLDVPYLVSLSTNSVPALEAIFVSPSYPGLTRDAVGAVLACRQRVHPLRSSLDWRSFTLSAWWARNAMGTVKAQLDGYRFTDLEPPVKLLTPDSVLYECGS